MEKASEGMSAEQSAAIQKVLKAKIDYGTLRPFEMSVHRKAKVAIDNDSRKS
ncbi:hypothetical protein [Oligoflexus tunisiensis]|uniref:hypothetical protein n=1 Tax=Oligoflexus tunisiensis TaxID=708132 RepID=UPI001C401C79|nr:hypothetical protein [Oligoflexus tunisiensis]